MPVTPTDRIQALPPYLFVQIDRRKRAALEAGRDVINFGIGDPDLPTPAFIIERLKRAAENPAYHRYPHDLGAPPYRQAVARFFQRRYGLSLDPEREILALIGSKEGLGHLPLALVNPGSTVLVPDPGYPVYTSGTIFAGGQPVPFPLREERGWLPDLSEIPAQTARDAVLMYVNYPNNPIGAVAPLSFYQELVAFARDHDLLIAQDAAYNDMYFGEPPPSILQVAGAKELAIEFHSCSKTFNMTGWRLAFVAGCPDALAALARIKSNLDSGQFTAIQEAAIAAYDGITHPAILENRATYRQRTELMARGLADLGFRVSPPAATFYVWAGLPGGSDSLATSARLLDEADIVAIPGVGFGRHGEGYLRFAMTVPLERAREALERMRKLSW